jgi:hypothetical protein
MQLLVPLALVCSAASAFLPNAPLSSTTTSRSSSSHLARAAAIARRTAPLSMAGFSEDFGWGQDVVRAQERKQRFADEGARVVEVTKPLGLILEEDKNGDVFVAEVIPGGNGAKSGVIVGDRVSMVSATFGNDLWSTQGAGLSRVTKAIKVRVGNSCKLVLQNKAEKAKAEKATKMSAAAKVEEFKRQAAKKNALLAELETEKNQAVKGGFGLFQKNFGLWGTNDE